MIYYLIILFGILFFFIYLLYKLRLIQKIGNYINNIKTNTQVMNALSLEEKLDKIDSNGNGIVFIKISPSLAEALLERNQINRPHKHKKSNEYATYMKNGEWMENTGESIKLDVNNNIIDGQHRLHAIIKTGLTMSFELRTGLPTKAIHFIDQGKVRNASDTLAMHKVKYYSIIASIVKRYFEYKNECSSVNVPNRNVYEFYNEYPDELVYCAQKAYKYYEQGDGLIFKSDIGSMLFITRMKNEEVAEEFMKKVALGMGITNMNDPASRLRNFLIDNSRSDKKVQYRDRFKTWLKFWNKYRMGEEVEKFHMTTKFEEAI